ncbi:hypothetical protein ECZC05_33620 [Escherichia coli]|nr:transposase [Escherichia coli]SQN33696.1 transposase [Escherichia coli]GJH50154.1 hypothetical protein ECZC02_09670 [Escherichia coli]GJH68389.1 hypothetical protein ECZC05_33620 [Escherichia coli]GJH77558.1 hypothetical protein ECZC07_14800 [Escherichia coli]
MVARGVTGSETIVRDAVAKWHRLDPTGYYCRKTSFSVPGKPLVDALENNQG